MMLELRTLASHVSNDRVNLQQLQATFPRLQASMETLISLNRTHKSEVDNAIEEVRKLKALVAEIREEFARNLTSQDKAQKQIIDERHSRSLALEGYCYSLEKKVEALEAKYEEMLLDVKNAVMKANLSDIHTQLNKKKIENIQLSLTRISKY